MSLAMHDDDMFQNSLVMVIICIALNVVIICQGFQMPGIFSQMCCFANTTADLLFIFADKCYCDDGYL